MPPTSRRTDRRIEGAEAEKAEGQGKPAEGLQEPPSAAPKHARGTPRANRARTQSAGKAARRPARATETPARLPMPTWFWIGRHRRAAIGLTTGSGLGRLEGSDAADRVLFAGDAYPAVLGSIVSGLHAGRGGGGRSVGGVVMVLVYRFVGIGARRRDEWAP